MKVKTNIFLKEKNTFQLDGTSKFWLDINNENDLFEGYEFIKKNNLKYFILGEGSNTVIPEFWNGIILHPNHHKLEIRISEESFFFELKNNFEYQEFYQIKQEKNLIEFINKLNKKDVKIQCIVDSGIQWDLFVFFCLIHQISGLEVLSGIPGKVGATPIQNVGAYGEEVKNFIQKVEVYDLKTFDKKIFENKHCDFSYRNSFFKKNLNQYFVNRVYFEFPLNYKQNIKYEELKKFYEEIQSKKEIIASIKQKLENLKFFYNDSILNSMILRYSVYNIRKKKGMIIEKDNEFSKNLGSFFLNVMLTEKEFEKFKEKILKEKPELKIPYFKENELYKIPSAWLIEYSGFYKGYEEKGFLISPFHSLCIINKNGNQKNLKEFIKKIQEKVYNKTNILLIPEPIFMENFM